MTGGGGGVVWIPLPHAPQPPNHYPGAVFEALACLLGLLEGSSGMVDIAQIPIFNQFHNIFFRELMK